MLNTGLETWMQIVQALKKVPIREQKLLKNVYSQEQLMTLHNKAVGRRVYKRLAKAKPVITQQNKKRTSFPSTFKTIFDYSWVQHTHSLPHGENSSLQLFQVPVTLSTVNVWVMNQFNLEPIRSSWSSNP